MDCEQVRDQFLSGLSMAEGNPWSDPVARHVRGCESCRAELEGLSRTWAVLGQWPEVAPRDEIRTRLVRRVRRELVRESILTVRGWVPAVLAAVVGVGLSLGLSLVVPYSLLVSWCQRVLSASELHAVPYLLAGMAYGIPLALGAWTLRKRLLGGPLIGGLEASALFLVILAPYVIVECRDFAPPLRAAFVSGLVGGAIVSSLAGLGLARLASSNTSQP